MYCNVLLNISFQICLFQLGFTTPVYERQRSPSPSEIDWNGLAESPKSPLRIEDLLSPLGSSGVSPALSMTNRESSTDMNTFKPIPFSPTDNALRPRKKDDMKAYRKYAYQVDKAKMQALSPDEQMKKKEHRNSVQHMYKARVRQRTGFSSVKIANLHHIRQLIKAGQATDEQKGVLKTANAIANEKKRKWRAQSRKDKLSKTVLPNTDNLTKTATPVFIPKKPRTKRKNPRST